MQQLHGDAPLGPGIDRLVDLAHSARAERTAQLVLARDKGPRELGRPPKNADTIACASAVAAVAASACGEALAESRFTSARNHSMRSRQSAHPAA